MTRIRSKVRSSLRTRGLRGTIWVAVMDVGRLVRRRWRALQELHFDLIHGVRTRGLVWHDPASKSGDAYAHAVHYQGVGPRAFRECIKVLDDDPNRYVFVDLGCGKGKAVVLASQHPFQGIVGVELSPDLVREARLNVRRIQRKRPTLPPIDIVQTDAASYSFPSDPLVVYMNNPFDDTVLARVVEHMGSQFAEAPHQRVFVIYESPYQRHVTDAAPYLELHRDLGHGVVYRATA